MAQASYPLKGAVYINVFAAVPLGILPLTLFLSVPPQAAVFNVMFGWRDGFAVSDVCIM